MQPPAGTFTRGEKGRLRNPINHLLEVASLVAEATQGKNPKVVIAALLHDAIEDQEVPRELIAREFGEDVAALVEEVSDDKALEKHHRKRIQVETAHKKSDDAKRIKLADKTSNLRAITFSARLVGQEETGIYQLGKTGCLGIARSITLSGASIRPCGRGG